jgi:hypothetical protein
VITPDYSAESKSNHQNAKGYQVSMPKIPVCPSSIRLFNKGFVIILNYKLPFAPSLKKSQRLFEERFFLKET